MLYLARITIHNGTIQDYDVLHKRMQALGFNRYITADNGTHYWLPDATYVGARNESITAVQQLVAREAKAAAPNRGEPQVFVCERSKSMWTGLSIAK